MEANSLNVHYFDEAGRQVTLKLPALFVSLSNGQVLTLTASRDQQGITIVDDCSAPNETGALAKDMGMLVLRPCACNIVEVMSEKVVQL
ncbi:MAG: hypothetical protein JJU30_12955 [Alkalimonas sp.]|nr:hypothetical protein [Alkalimonas sp.]